MRRLTTFGSTIARSFEALGLRGKRLLLAVSGGADSLALLYAAAEAHPRQLLVAATVDHGSRPETAAEAAAVRQHAQRLGIEHLLSVVKVELGASFEARAREARYAALEALRRDSRCDFTLTAHTANDQSETVLMRLLRGATARGARGIAVRREHVVRPLLGVTRSEVEAYLASLELTPVRDPMNEDERFFRVAVRRRVLPLLERLAPGSLRRIAAFAQSADEDDAYLQQVAADAEARLRIAGGGWDATGIAALAAPVRRRLLAAVTSGHGAELDRPLILAAERAILTGGSAELTRGVMLHAQGGVVRVVREAAVAPADKLRLGVGERCVDPRSGRSFTLLHSLSGAAREDFVALSAATPLPLCIRAREAGDRVTDGKKLQDVLVDAGVPREQRDLLAVVTDAAGRIVWVPGVWPKRQASEQGTLFLISNAR